MNPTVSLINEGVRAIRRLSPFKVKQVQDATNSLMGSDSTPGGLMTVKEKL